jgi:hypothetical protein
MSLNNELLVVVMTELTSVLEALADDSIPFESEIDSDVLLQRIKKAEAKRQRRLERNKKRLLNK